MLILLWVHIHSVPLKLLITINRKPVAAANSALSMTENVFYKPQLSDKSRAILHHIKLDMVAVFHLSWWAGVITSWFAASLLLKICLFVPPIYEDQKMDLLHVPFKGTTLFGGELAKLQKVTTEWANALIVLPIPAAPLTSCSPRPYVS